MRDGRKMPTTWAITARGQFTDDPAAAMDGTLLPIGEYKGYGLSLITIPSEAPETVQAELIAIVSCSFLPISFGHISLPQSLPATHPSVYPELEYGFCQLRTNKPKITDQ